MRFSAYQIVEPTSPISGDEHAGAMSGGPERRAWLACVALLAFLAILFAAPRTQSSAWAATVGTCSPIRPTPPAFPSDCSFQASDSVAAGGTLTLAVVGPSRFQIETASTGQGCAPIGQQTALLSSLTLACPTGLPAGASISLTVATYQRDPFIAPLAATYNAESPTPTTDAVTLSSLPPPSPTVTYQAGWNLVGGPAGTILTGAVGPLYTYRADDTRYEALPADTPLQAGVGYWAYFPTATSITLPSATPQALSVPLPASRWIMIGNPFDLPVTLSGGSGAAVVAEAYDASNGWYQPVPQVPCCQLDPGLGAWVFSAGGGSVRLSLGPGPP